MDKLEKAEMKAEYLREMKLKARFLRERIKQLQKESRRVETYIRVTEWREKQKKDTSL